MVDVVSIALEQTFVGAPADEHHTENVEEGDEKGGEGDHDRAFEVGHEGRIEGGIANDQE